MWFFLVVFGVAFVIVFFLAMKDSDSTMSNILSALFLSVLIAGVLWLFASMMVTIFVTPSIQVIDNTATLLPIDLNNGKVALGYETVSDSAKGKYYVYKDKQDESTKYLFIEQNNSLTDFGIDVKLIDANQCKISYIDDKEPCRVEYYHAEYEGFVRAIRKAEMTANDCIILYIHKNSMEEIWFPYSN